MRCRWWWAAAAIAASAAGLSASSPICSSWVAWALLAIAITARWDASSRPGEGVVGHPVYRRRAARTGGRQVIDLGLQRGDVGGEIDCGVGHVGARFGEGAGGGG